MKKIKIGIPARDLSKKCGGTKEYLLGLLESLNRKKLKGIEIHALYPKNEYIKKFSNLIGHYIPLKNKIFWDYVLAPYMLNKLKVDISIFPKNVIPFFINSQKIVIIYDVIYFMPQYNAYREIDNLYMKQMIRSSCARADLIIAVSQNTKKDILNIFDVRSEKIKVIYGAANSRYKHIKDRKKLDKIRNKYVLPEKFILFTGEITPRKNLACLIKAFNRATNKIPHWLILTGNSGWKNKEELKLIVKSKKVKRIKFVEDEHMPALYTLSDIFIYPSLYEGFGLPILEAQACNCPVICSKVSSLPELGKKSVHYINPYSIGDIEGAIIKLAENNDYKNKLISKGKTNFKHFSWEKTAEEFLSNVKKAYLS